ncbi:MAG: hydrogenase expression/formation protein HypE [Dehalococcoidales bacterium]|nr:MAG: hydrogenase expression/formation protein HypE [Dehalococcoidales bacterium]
MGTDDRILLAHGSGGKLSHDLIESFLPLFDNKLLDKLDDSAVFQIEGRLAFTTDSYVVSPIFFPGGDIGKLAVCGTINDLAMSGAVPLYLSLSLIIEEGLPLDDLQRVMASVKKAAEEAGVNVVTGDTKVVNRGNADRLFINTSGIGVVPPGVDISGSKAKPGDSIILSGTIGDHGIAVMSQREGLEFSSPVGSDCAPLHSLVADILGVSDQIHCLRDPTRGGLASTLNELARQSKVGIRIEEEKIPVREGVRAACELLGLEPLYVANEGKLVAVVPGAEAKTVIDIMHKNPYGKQAIIIGEVVAEHPGRVVMKTGLGASRIVDMLVGELLPRIC